MKILSDFDGVMTDQGEEAQYQRRLFCEQLARVSDRGDGAVTALIERAEAELLARPSAHGWWSGGRLAAYADEDLFIRLIGVASCLDGWADQGDVEVASLRRRLADDGLATFQDLSNWSYARMVEHTRLGATAPLDPVVSDVLGRLMAAGHQVVVVSNSSTDRVIDILRTAALDPRGHDEDAGAPLRVRGGARKFELGEAPEPFEVGGLRFDAARPRYREILEQEQPAAVIGDVFSLDLALPLHLAITAPGRFGGLRLLLRTRSYTPAWSRGLFEAGHGAARLARLDDFADLPARLGL